MLGMSVPSMGQLESNFHIYQAAQISFWYPDQWQVNEAEQISMIQSPDESFSLTFSRLEAQDLEAGLLELESVLQQQLTQIQAIGDPTIIELNDFLGVSTELTAQLDNTPVRVRVLLVDGLPQVLLVLGMGSSRSYESYQADLDQIISSIKAIE